MIYIFDLLNWGVDVNIKGERFNYALTAAVSEGHEATVRLLLKKGADVNAKDKYGRTALQRAAGRGHEAIVQLLISFS
jgi:ankyrin repeat protein